MHAISPQGICTTTNAWKMISGQRVNDCPYRGHTIRLHRIKRSINPAAATLHLCEGTWGLCNVKDRREQNVKNQNRIRKNCAKNINARTVLVWAMLGISVVVRQPTLVESGNRFVGYASNKVNRKKARVKNNKTSDVIANRLKAHPPVLERRANRMCR